MTVEPAFGYRIGDSIVAVARVAVDQRAQLDAESLPKVGRLHGWLSLEEVKVESEPGGGRKITRVFQVTASAPEPRVLYLPKVELRFRLDGRELVEQLESVPVAVAPIAPSKPVLRSGFGVLRPDRDVPAPAPREALLRAGWLAVALAVLALLWAGLRMVALRRPGYAPFENAARKLRRLARGRRDAAAEQVVGAGFRIMHEAFNQAAGQAVFSAAGPFPRRASAVRRRSHPSARLLRPVRRVLLRRRHRHRRRQGGGRCTGWHGGRCRLGRRPHLAGRSCQAPGKARATRQPMNLEFAHPQWLWLLPLAALPWLRRSGRDQVHPWLALVPPDRFSTVVDWTVRLAGSLLIAAALMAIAGLQRKEQPFERISRGAEIVVLLDRSRSMDQSLAHRAQHSSGRRQS